MNIIKKILFTTFSPTIVLGIALSCPSVASAVSIGEIVSQSKLGDPLSLRIALSSNPGEKIDSSCVSLSAPDPDEVGALDYVVSANLAVTQEIGQQFVVISSHKPYIEAFGKILLRVNCRGQASVAKTLTFLPDLDATPPSEISPPEVISETTNVNIPSSINQQESVGIAPSSGSTITQNLSLSQVGTRPVTSPSPSATQRKGQRSSASKSLRKKRGHEVFMFKLSSEPIDESRIGKISPDERELLLAKQKLLDADDQMASFLAMKHQIKQLQDELGEIKLKLSQLSADSPIAELPGASTDGGGKAAADAKAKKFGFFAGSLVLAILALLLGLRYYNRIRIQRLGDVVWESVPLEASSPEVSPPVARPAALNTGSGAFIKPQPATPQTTSIARATPSIQTSTYSKSQEELSEADSIIEEAELYSTYGHPERAILMLQELIRQQPGKGEAWELLLFILSSQKKSAEFERTAREFMPLGKSSGAWKKIQAMGRILERNNPLYADASATEPAAISPLEHPPGKRRLIGNILVETGSLSSLDMKNYLDDFDPKQDGRLGEYLVSRKAITNEQLIDALRIQQGSAIPEKNQQPDASISHDIDEFIPDSGLKRDERLDEYLKMDMSRSNKPKKT